MKFKQKATLALAVIALTATNFAAAQNTLLNASYDVSREFYKDYNAAFVAHYKKTAGKDVKIRPLGISQKTLEVLDNSQ
ncbi:MAG: hypothetical protein JZU64_13270, partial [Rhodoferax sp.]|nr:hypothetical protein [Rhodoferax sp.]